MTTQAVFDNIPQHIAHELNQARHSIYVAVAWFTREDLFEILLAKAMAGVRVQLALSNDTINRTAKIRHDYLNQFADCQTHWIGDGDTKLMHHKFCVIDEQVVITGSFNWSKRAEHSNHENITISHDSLLAKAFIQQFYHLIGRPAPQQIPSLPIDTIIKRLEILKNYVVLQDLDDISRENQKLKRFDSEQDIADIYQAVKGLQFSRAVELIDQFIKKYHSLAVYQEADIMALKLEIRLLEHEIETLDATRAELEKLLADFNYRHSMSLGDLISEILTLNKELAKQQNDDDAYAQAEQDEQSYHEQLHEQQNKVHYTLSEDEQKRLKQAYRKASQLCHPDRVNDEQKAAAEQVFTELRQAYEENDLEKVEQILADVQQGVFKSRSQTVSQLDKLKLIKQELIQKLGQIKAMIETIKNSESYRIICQINDWDEYFATQGQALSRERDRLKSQIIES